jgi:hypothetical protein
LEERHDGAYGRKRSSKHKRNISRDTLKRDTFTFKLQIFKKNPLK